MFKRYLPTLQLKKQQLYMEIVKIENSYKIKNLEQQKLKENISNWISLFSEKFPLRVDSSKNSSQKVFKYCWSCNSYIRFY